MNNELVSMEVTELLKRAVAETLSGLKESIEKSIRLKTALFIDDVLKVENKNVHVYVDINTSSQIEGNLIEISFSERGKGYILQTYSNNEDVGTQIVVQEPIMIFLKETGSAIDSTQFGLLKDFEEMFEKNNNDFKPLFTDSLEAELLLMESLEPLKEKAIDRYLELGKFEEIKRIQKNGLDKKDLEILK